MVPADFCIYRTPEPDALNDSVDSTVSTNLNGDSLFSTSAKSDGRALLRQFSGAIMELRFHSPHAIVYGRREFPRRRTILLPALGLQR